MNWCRPTGTPRWTAPSSTPDNCSNAQQAVGFDELAKRVAEFPPQRAAEICPWPPTTSAKQPEFSALRKAAVNGVAGIKDDELLNLTKRCHPQSLRQMRWANAMLEELSPQTLAS